MPYIGQPPVVGDTTTSFRLLDNIASYTLTFDATSSDIVSTTNDTLTFSNHRFVTAQRVTYTNGGGTAIGGLTSGTAYFIIKVDQNTIKLATSAANANAGTAINLSSGAVGNSHTLNVAFDGINTKFKATYNNGTKAKISRAGQLLLSINGVIQQPQETSAPTVGFGIDADSTIVFSTAPVNTDVVFGNIIANTIASFDLSENTVDNFTGDGSTISFNLSKTPPNNQNVLVTLDGVVQYPSDTTTTRAYSVVGNLLTFASAPGNGVEIQVRHIGFAGATTSAVTGFYGRTGNAVLTSADDITVQNITGVAATFTGNVSIAGTLTYEDVTNIDSVGLITARSGAIINTGTATTALVVNGDARITGILTVGTSSVTIDGNNNQIKVGTGVTITTSGIVATVGVTTVAAGSASAPSISFTNDPNTGLYSPGADQLALATGGSGRLFVDANGRLGLGASSPTTAFDIAYTDAKIRIADTSSGGEVAFWGCDTIGAYVRTFVNDTFRFQNTGGERLRITSDGKLGLGTSSPSTKLHVNSADSSATYLRVENTSGQAYFGVDGSGNTYAGAETNDAFGLVTNGTYRMYITAGGSVGIGTTAPSARLHVNGSNAGIILQHAGNSSYSALYTDTNNTLQFVVGGGPSEAARFDASGRLLVGTSSARTVDGFASAIQAEGTDAADSSINVYRNSNNEYGAYLTFGKSRSTSLGGSALVSANDEIGVLDFCGADGTDTDSMAARIAVHVDGTPGANDMPGRLVFSTTADGASSPTERLRIAQNGAWGLAGANYGSSSQVLTSNGSGSAPTWQNAPAPAALSTASGSAPSYSARAWVNFNGTGTVAIRSSGNVSSITDNGTGNYTVNFSTAMSDANYAVCWTAADTQGNTGAVYTGEKILSMATSSVQVTYGNSAAAGPADPTWANVVIMR